MLPIIIFGASLIGSIFWLAGSAVYIESRIGWENLVTMNPSDIAFFITAILLPIVVLWIIIGFIHYTGIIRRQGYFLTAMLDQLKRTSGQNEVILKNLITGQEQNKNNDMLKYIDIELADLNNVIAEIAVRFGIMRKTSEDALWERVGQGNRWAFCQVILENAEETEDFSKALKKRMARDEKLTKAVNLFLSRFEKVLQMLSSTDFNRPFIETLENCNLGALYSLLANIENFASPKADNEETAIPEDEISSNQPEESSFQKALFNSPETVSSNPEESIDFSPIFDEEEIVTIEITNQKENAATTAIDSDWEARKKEILAKYSKKEPEEDLNAPAFLKNTDWNS